MKDQEEKSVSTRERMSSRLTFVGGGIGLGLFAIFGVINASFIGGIIGLNLAGLITGFPVESSVLSRIIVALGMLTGIMVAGLLFVLGGALAGWVVGKLIDRVRTPAAQDDKGQLKGSH